MSLTLMTTSGTVCRVAIPRIFCYYGLSLGCPMCKVASFAPAVCGADGGEAVFDVLVVVLPTLPAVEALF